MAKIVEVKIDEKVHPNPPQDEASQLVWAALDTAYNLLRETAAEVTFMEVRKQAKEQGFEYPDEAVMFAQAAERGIRGWYDLAPDHPLAIEGIKSVFDVLAMVAMQEAEEGING